MPTPLQRLAALSSVLQRLHDYALVDSELRHHIECVFGDDDDDPAPAADLPPRAATERAAAAAEGLSVGDGAAAAVSVPDALPRGAPSPSAADASTPAGGQSTGTPVPSERPGEASSDGALPAYVPEEAWHAAAAPSDEPRLSAEQKAVATLCDVADRVEAKRALLRALIQAKRKHGAALDHPAYQDAVARLRSERLPVGSLRFWAGDPLAKAPTADLRRLDRASEAMASAATLLASWAEAADGPFRHAVRLAQEAGEAVRGAMAVWGEQEADQQRVASALAVLAEARGITPVPPPHAPPMAATALDRLLGTIQRARALDLSDDALCFDDEGNVVERQSAEEMMAEKERLQDALQQGGLAIERKEDVKTADELRAAAADLVPWASTLREAAARVEAKAAWLAGTAENAAPPASAVPAPADRTGYAALAAQPAEARRGASQVLMACAQAAARVADGIERFDGSPGALRADVELLAEAQSMLRALALRHGFEDADQLALFRTLAGAGGICEHARIYVSQYLSLHSLAKPERVDALLVRLMGRPAPDPQKQAKEGIKKVQYHARKLAKGGGASDLARIDETLGALVPALVPPSDARLRTALLPYRERLASVEAPTEGLRAVVASLSAPEGTAAEPGPAKQAPKTPAKPTAFAPEVAQLRHLLGGRGVLIVGGAERPDSLAKLHEALGHERSEWLPWGHHKSTDPFEYRIRQEHIAVACVPIKFSSHSFGPAVRSFCKKYGKLFVNLPAGYSPNRVAKDILEQVSDHLEAQRLWEQPFADPDDEG